MSRIPATASTDVQQSFKELWDALNAVRAPLQGLLGSNDLNLAGRRILNLGPAQANGDAVNKGDLTKALAQFTPGAPAAGSSSSSSSAPVGPPAAVPTQDILVGTHAQRLAAAATPLRVGTLWLESDRSMLYLRVTSTAWVLVGSFTVFDFLGNRPADLAGNDAGFLFLAADQGVLYRWSGSVWIYSAGVYRDVIANRPIIGNCDTGMIFVATNQGQQAWIKDYASNTWRLLEGWGDPLDGTLPIGALGLGTPDAGFRYRSTDFDRVYQWTGAAWVDAPGQPRRGMMVFAEANLGTGWHNCDGTTVTISKADGTVDAAKLLPGSLSSVQPFTDALLQYRL